MPDRTRLEISAAGESDFPAVQSFYTSAGYGGGVADGDRVLVGRQGDAIVAAVKLSPEGGTLVLRGMYVSGQLRGQGLGSTLLERIPAVIGPSRCWCIPFAHLVSFYSRIGFRVVESGEAPEFLRARWERYVAAGHDVIIMGRSASAGNGE